MKRTLRKLVLPVFASQLVLFNTNAQLTPTFDVEMESGETIQIPDGRPIYAVMISGYKRNANLDELHFYKFAKHIAEKGGYVHFSWWNNFLKPCGTYPKIRRQAAHRIILGTSAGEPTGKGGVRRPFKEASWHCMYKEFPSLLFSCSLSDIINTVIGNRRPCLLLCGTTWSDNNAFVSA